MTSCRFISALLLSVVVMLPAAALAAPGDDQLAFARHLDKNGDDAFALLEYKRFLFQNPTHASAGDVATTVARLYISYLGDVDSAVRVMRDLAAANPNTEIATKAQGFITFFEANNDFEGKPLSLYLTARAALGRGFYQRAVSSYTKITEQFPTARLADDAAFELAVMYGENMDQHDKSVELLNQFAAKYPNSELKPSVQQKLAAIELKKLPIERQFEKQYIASFTVAKEGYEEADRYRVYVVLPNNLAEREVKATLEEALMQTFAKRKDPAHRIRIDAFYSYPGREIATATWAPKEQPNYKMIKQSREEIATDLLFDLLRKK